MTTDVKTPYGPKSKVHYGDPGYRDATARYPIDTPAHIRAAWAYINVPKNAEMYTGKQLELIKQRIREAAVEHGIDIQQAPDAGAGQAAIAVATGDEGSLVAGSAPLAPPAAWFADPGLAGPTKLTISPDGHIFGHLAQWRVCHVGIGNACVMAPHTKTNYSLFKQGSVVTADGTEVPVGKITLGTAHANAQYGVMPARDHYDNTGMAAAVVNAGEDSHGIWVNGSLVSTMTPEKIAELRASALSGDWRTVNGNLELIAALAVNSPGFPIYRTQGGAAFSLQAIGVLGAPEQDEISGDFSVDNGTEVEVNEDELTPEQAERLSQLAAIEEELEEHRQQQRFAQLALLDGEREKASAPKSTGDPLLHMQLGRRLFQKVDPKDYFGDDESTDEE